MQFPAIALMVDLISRYSERYATSLLNGGFMRKKVVTGLIIALCVGVSSAQANPITIDFDSLTAGTVLNNQFAGLGVTFSNSDGNLIVQNATPGPPFSAPNAILPENYFTFGNYSQATFSVPVSFVSVVLGDFDADADTLFLQLFDSSNNLIGSDTQLLGSSIFGGLLLTASAPNIAYARFWGVGVNNNSDYFDNFTFDSQATVPEPASLLLLGSGLVGVGRRAWRRRRATSTVC